MTVRGTAPVQDVLRPVSLEGGPEAWRWTIRTVRSRSGGSRDASSCSPIAVKTSFAPIRLALSPAAGYAVTARTSFGKIESEFPLLVRGGVGSDAATGRIGDGRCEVSLTNSNGNIEILKGAGPS